AGGGVGPGVSPRPASDGATLGGLNTADGRSSARLDSVSRTEALITLDAIGGNVATLKRATPAEVMAVVKADGYGHGLLPAARAALAGGATWLGTAIIDEALLLRAGGIQVPILAWVWGPSAPPGRRQAYAAACRPSVARH